MSTTTPIIPAATSAGGNSDVTPGTVLGRSLPPLTAGPKPNPFLEGMHAHMREVLTLTQLDGSTDLAILDTSDFTGPPVARIRIPHRVPADVHGNRIEG